MTAQTIKLLDDFTQADLDRICEWLRANYINPKAVPTWSEITVEDGEIRYLAYLRDEEGRVMADPEALEVLTEERTAPLVQPWIPGPRAQVVLDMTPFGPEATEALRSALAEAKARPGKAAALPSGTAGVVYRPSWWERLTRWLRR